MAMDSDPQADPSTKRKAAVALSYDSEKNPTPRVVASGKGSIAEQIIKIAKEHQIPTRENSILAQALGKVEVGQEIPPDLYRAVAEVLAFVYRLNEKMESS